MESYESAHIAGFWRRIAALLVDLMLLAAVGFLVGNLAADQLERFGVGGRLFGLAFALLYFTLLWSYGWKGQTVGQRLLAIRVVDANGAALPWARSLLRASFVSLWWLASEVPNILLVAPGIWFLATVAGSGLGGAMATTYLFNRKTRQGLHDLLAGSYMVDATPVPFPVMERSARWPLRVGMAWVGLIAVGATVNLALASPFGPYRETVRAGDDSNNVGLTLIRPSPDLSGFAAIPGVRSVEVEQIRNLTGQGDRVNLSLGYVGNDESAAASSARARVLSASWAAGAKDIEIRMMQGWDLGVARTVRTTTHTSTRD